MAATKLKKKQNLHGEGIHIFDLVTGLLDGIWNEITSYQGQEWDLPKSKKSLESLIGKDETEKLYGITDTKLQNIYLRNLLAAPLRDDDHNKRIKAMDWIVVYWGRIAKGKEAHKEWVSELKDYDDASVENFIKLKKNKRVSSWSKILAFYDSENYAIFDTVGFVMRLLFTAVEMAGFMIGMSMGLGFASFYDPQAQGQSIAIGQFLTMLALLIFMSLDGHLIVVAVMLQSFETMPIALEHWQLNSQMVANLGGHIFAAGLLLSLPVVASLLITNMALGVLTKAAPQFNIFGIGFPITISVGFLMTLLSLPSLVSPVSLWLVDAQQLMLQVLR